MLTPMRRIGRSEIQRLTPEKHTPTEFPSNSPLRDCREWVDSPMLRIGLDDVMTHMGA